MSHPNIYATDNQTLSTVFRSCEAYVGRTEGDPFFPPYQRQPAGSLFQRLNADLRPKLECGFFTDRIMGCKVEWHPCGPFYL
jgi:hypothetical protein